MTIQEEIIKIIEQKIQERNDKLREGFIWGCKQCEEIINSVFRENGKRLPAVTVKEAIEMKIINSPFALKGSYSGKMYFYSWKKSISKMPKDIAELELSMNFDYNNCKELGSYNIEPMVRLVESSFSNKPYLEPYVLVWVSDYELSKKRVKL